MADSTLSFNLLAKDNASGAFKKISKSADDTGRKFGILAARSHGMTAGISLGLGRVATAMGAVATVQVFTGFINDARESAKVARLTEQVIKSTGKAAHVSAEQVGALATSISNKTGADDEAIQSGQNLLLTFTNIHNEVGKGNDIFNQASQAIVDMTAALNNGEVTTEGMKSSSIQLGKALNDPVKGVTALQKVGVSFTAKQKEQIKTLVDSGRTLDAQKIILKEIQKEFGAAAAAAADPLTRLKTIAGNLSESIGGLLLPVVGKFANFLANTAIPGLYAMGAAFQEGDVTSDGFVGVMERIGVTAKRVFGYFRTEVLPRLKEFGSFVIGTAVPAVVAFAQNLATSLGPSVKSLFNFFRAEVLPRLQQFAGFVRDSVLPTIGDLATRLSKDKDVLVPLVAAVVGAVVAFKVVTGAIRAWAAAQAILNVVLTANPIGLVIVGLAALGAGLVIAYKKSETFRDIVQGTFAVVKSVVSTFAPLVKAVFAIVSGVISLWWNYYAKPIFTAFKLGLKSIWEQAQTFGRIVSAVWNGIKEPARVAIKFVIDRFLGFVQTVLDGAARAFGWVPKLGPKLQTAAKEFGKFRDNVNRSLDGIDDEAIKVALSYSAKGINLSAPSSVGRRAMGGSIHGPGTGTSDSAGLYALSNGEHVVTAREVRGAGGHAGVEAMRRVWAGGMAAGGAVDLRLLTSVPGTRAIGNVSSAVARRAGADIYRLERALGINPRLQGVLDFVRSQVGKPYIWGGSGPAGFDCSGLVGAAINKAFGRNPFSRLGSTGTMPWSSFAPGRGSFMVGWFKGNPGHTAATVNGVNIESAGGVGVRMGSGARGAWSSLFTHRAHVKGFARGGAVGDAPFDLLAPGGDRYLGQHLAQALNRGVLNRDTGGLLPPGPSLVYNGTGRNERVVNSDVPVVIDARSTRGFDRMAATWLLQLIRTDPAAARQLKVLLT